MLRAAGVAEIEEERELQMSAVADEADAQKEATRIREKHAKYAVSVVSGACAYVVSICGAASTSVLSTKLVTHLDSQRSCSVVYCCSNQRYA